MAFSSGEFIVEFDPVTLKRMSAMVTAMPIFARYYLSAMNYSVNQVAARAAQPGYAPVGQYTDGRTGGTLRRGIRGFAESPYVGRVGVIKAVPYARRREYGFDGRTDRLGRHYTQDPKDPDKRLHMLYLHRALHDSYADMMSAFRISTQLAIREIAAI